MKKACVVAWCAASLAFVPLAHAQIPTQPPPTQPTPAVPPPPPQPPTQPPPSQPPPVQPAPMVVQPPAPPPTPAPPAEPERKSTTTFGVGMTYAASVPVNGSRVSDGYGAVLEVGRNIPIAERVAIGLRFAWGLTEWSRFTRAAKAGYDVGAWTTEAYGDVYDWTKKNSGAPNTHGLRLFAGAFALGTLWIGYLISGLVYAAAVVAPTTFLEADITGGYDFGDAKVNPYLKGGIGLLAFVHPEYGTLRGGIGPTVSGGVQFGTFQIGGTFTWSPPPLHGEARSDLTHVYVGALTLGLSQ